MFDNSKNNQSVSRVEKSENQNDLDTDIEISIPCHKKVSTHMETYILYDILTSGSRGSFSVTRRYGDFDWLIQLLMERYPMAIIPPLPQKHSVTAIERFVGSFIERRQFALCQFLRRLVAHPIVGLDSDCWAFLTLSSTAFLEHRKSRPVLGRLEVLLQSLQGLATGAGASNGGGCVDNLYRAELDRYVENTTNVGGLLHRLERVVSRCSEQWSSVGERKETLLNNLKVLTEVGVQCDTTGKAVKDRLEPWVSEYSLYCTVAEKAARRRQSIETKYLASQIKTEGHGQENAVGALTTTNKLHDSLSRSNADLKSEFDRWQTQRSCESKAWLASFADIHVEHYQRTCDIWRQFISTLHILDEGSL